MTVALQVYRFGNASRSVQRLSENSQEGNNKGSKTFTISLDLRSSAPAGTGHHLQRLRYRGLYCKWVSQRSYRVPGEMRHRASLIFTSRVHRNQFLGGRICTVAGGQACYVSASRKAGGSSRHLVVSLSVDSNSAKVAIRISLDTTVQAESGNRSIPKMYTVQTQENLQESFARKHGVSDELCIYNPSPAFLTAWVLSNDLFKSCYFAFYPAPHQAYIHTLGNGSPPGADQRAWKICRQAMNKFSRKSCYDTIPPPSHPPPLPVSP